MENKSLRCKTGNYCQALTLTLVKSNVCYNNTPRIRKSIFQFSLSVTSIQKCSDVHFTFSLKWQYLNNVTNTFLCFELVF